MLGTTRHRLWHSLLGISVLLIIYLLYRPMVNLALIELPKAHNVPRATSLLGTHEDTAKLWFPARNDGDGFHPKPLGINLHPPDQSPPRAPLFIGFTRNNDMMIQTILSVIAAGWPREDVIVVDNSGTMDANPRGLISRANPFFLDYDILRMRYGVNVLQTPTLLSFSQLQNFFLRTAMSHGWPYYFTAHMDVVFLSDESVTPYKSFFARVIDILGELGVHGREIQSVRLGNDWATKFFASDWLALVNVNSWQRIGAWDTFIPYYHSDCDAYSRANLKNYSTDEVRAGLIYDLAVTLPEPETQFFPSEQNESINSLRFRDLRARLESLMAAKEASSRNTWQAKGGDGGRGEAWTYDPGAFQKAWWEMDKLGRQWYKTKWQTLECNMSKTRVRMGSEFAGLRTTHLEW